MKNKVPMPVIVIAVVCLVAFLAVMGKKFLAPPEALHTAPPPWIDAATGKPKGQMSGSSPASTPSGGSGKPTTGGAASGGQ